MQRLLNKLKEFCYKHYKLLLTILLFTCAHSCFHRGSKVNQDNLREIYGIEFPPCRAFNEWGIGNEFGWHYKGELIFDEVPSESFYLSLDETPREKGYTYHLNKYVTGEIEGERGVDILGFEGYMNLTITKGDSVATYKYGKW